MAFSHPAVAGAEKIVAGDLTLTLDSTGQIVGLENNSVLPNVDHSLLTKRSSIVSFTVESSASKVGSSPGTTAHRRPTSWSYVAVAKSALLPKEKKGDYTFQFADRISAVVEVIEKQGYATFRLKSIANPGNLDIRNVIWGPIIVDIVALVGDLVGVASNRDFAVGMFGTNPKTTGGWPFEYRDIGHRADVIDTPQEFGRNGRFWYEISAARPHSFGTVIQAYTRSYTVERSFRRWGWQHFSTGPVPALTGRNASYGTLTDSKVAVFGVARKEGTDWWLSKRDAMADQVLTRIGDIEVGELMPHPIIGGIWAKKSTKSTRPYIITTGLNSGNLGRSAAFARDVGFESVYADELWGIFSSHGGSYTIRTNLGGTHSDPDRRFKQVVEDTKRIYHVGIGSHSLSNWVAPGDAVVINNRQGLAYGAVGTLRSVLGPLGGGIQVKPPSGLTVSQLTQGWYGFHNPGDYYHDIDKTVLIGSEIVRYGGFSVNQGQGYVTLTGVHRGERGTSAQTHGRDTTIRRLIGYGYSHTYVAGFDMGVNTIAPRMSTVIDLGIADFSFDGSEAALMTHDALGLAAFVKKVYDGLEDQHDFINDAAVTVPYNWHIHSRYNWGETRGDVTQSHQQYRWANQIYFARNYLPTMMGWWNINSNNMNQWRWAMAKMSSFNNAGFAYYEDFGPGAYTALTSIHKAEIFDWNNASLAGAFDEQNKFLMRDHGAYFELDKIARSGGFGASWKLSDWNTTTSSRSGSRYIAPQMVGHPLVNLARDAVVSASSRADTGYNADMVVDGFTGVGRTVTTDKFTFPNIEGSGEWVKHEADGDPWIQLTWERSRKIRQIILYDRALETQNVNRSRLEFSDGSRITVPAHPLKGDAVIINFPQKTVNWVRYVLERFIGDAPGLSEFVVLGPSAWYENCNLTRGATVTGASSVSDNAKIIDGNLDDANAVLLSGNSVTIDLQRQHLISGLTVWRKYSDKRTYEDVVFEISQNSNFSSSEIVFNNDGNNSLAKGTGSDTPYPETALGKSVMFAPVKGRYVRVWASRSSVDSNRHLVEVEVYGVASGIDSSASATTNAGLTATQAIDSNLSTEVDLGLGAKYLQIDLGGTKKINSLAVFRSFPSGGMPTFKGLVYEISNSSSFPRNSTTTVFNNDYADVHALGLSSSDGEFNETQNGHFVRFPPVQGRYLRLYSNGSHEYTSNIIREVLVGTDE